MRGVYISLVLFMQSDTGVARVYQAIYAGHFENNIFMIITRYMF